MSDLRSSGEEMHDEAGPSQDTVDVLRDVLDLDDDGIADLAEAGAFGDFKPTVSASSAAST